MQSAEFYFLYFAQIFLKFLCKMTKTGQSPEFCAKCTKLQNFFVQSVEPHFLCFAQNSLKNLKIFV
nr:MAG TPA: hypothetical protein [Caudoviricetes sp.]